MYGGLSPASWDLLCLIWSVFSNIGIIGHPIKPVQISYQDQTNVTFFLLYIKDYGKRMMHTERLA